MFFCKRYEKQEHENDDDENQEHENQKFELKMIFGSDPIKIVEKYLSEYACGFLNASGGTIWFGAQEHEKFKIGHIVGIVVPSEKRRELVKKAVTAFSKFYPPLIEGQFRLIFHKVIVPSKLDMIVRDEQSGENGAGTFVLLCGPAEEIGPKWKKFVKDELKDSLCRVIPVKPECFCIVVENKEVIKKGFESKLNAFVKQNKKIKKDSMTESDLQQTLKQLCLIELRVYKSHYPIHLIKPIETHVLDKQGNLTNLTMEKLMRSFELGKDPKTKFQIEQFLNDVDNFEESGNSFILITSPFELAKTERYFHGLTLPHWDLVIDFDQYPKKECHLFHEFKKMNDILQSERECVLTVPTNTKTGINAGNAVCWLAARGYDKVQKTLSKEG